jgi:hypothetical protein
MLGDTVQASTESWTGEVSDALAGLCEGECATRGAILDAIGCGLVAEPTTLGGWLARREGQELALYVIAGRALNTVRGPCAQHRAGAQPDGAVTASVQVSRVPFRDDAKIDCRIERTEHRVGGEISATRVLHWRFDRGLPSAVLIEPDSADPRKRAEAEQAERFARAIAMVLAEPDSSGS